MQEISDFELIYPSESSRFLGLGEPALDPIPDNPPPNKYWRSFKYTDGCGSLYYRGRRIRHIQLNGSFFYAQYKCREGFFLITGSEADNLKWEGRYLEGNVTVGYIREDFSGMHWGTLFTRWRCLEGPRNKDVDESELDCNPIRSLKIESEDRLLLTFKGGERYRITIYVPPKRFVCTFDLGLFEGPYWFNLRNLCINRVFW